MDYNKTINLPKTDFPMRAGLPKREPEMLKRWQEQDVYNELLKKNEGKPLFNLHDGPKRHGAELFLILVRAVIAVDQPDRAGPLLLHRSQEQAPMRRCIRTASHNRWRRLSAGSKRKTRPATRRSPRPAPPFRPRPGPGPPGPSWR